MALLVLENFDHLNTIVEKYTVEHTTYVIASSGDGRGGGTSRRCYAGYWMVTAITPSTTGVMGFALWLSTAQTADAGIMFLFEGATHHISL